MHKAIAIAGITAITAIVSATIGYSAGLNQERQTLNEMEQNVMDLQVQAIVLEKQCLQELEASNATLRALTRELNILRYGEANGV